MSYSGPIPAIPRVISPSPTPSESSEKQEGYFTRSTAKKQRQRSPQPDSIQEEKDNGSSSDSSLEKRARTRSRSPRYTPAEIAAAVNGNAVIPGSAAKRRRLSGLTPITKSEPLVNGHLPQPQSEVSGHLSPYARVQKSWRDFSRSPSPLGLIPLHRHYRYLIHKHEIPRKALHVSIGFFTLQLYQRGLQRNAITPWLMGALIPIASVDILRHRSERFNRIYIKVLGGLMRETEVSGYNGVIWYLLGAYIALRFYPKDVGVMSVLLLSWCDTAASTFGRLYGRYTIRLRRGKSLAGTLAAFATGVLAAIYFWGYLVPKTGSFPDDPPNAYMFQGRLSLPVKAKELLGWDTSPQTGTIGGTAALVVMSLCTGVLASFSEFVDLFGWDDNLTIPLLSSAAIYGFLKVFGS